LSDAEAREHFNRLPPSLKRQYAGWVISAKREETQQRRLRELVDVLSRGERLGLKYGGRGSWPVDA